MQQPTSHQLAYIFLFTISALLLYLLAPILTPFLLGALLAYLTDPLVKRLEKHHIPHILSVVLVFFFIIAIFLILIFLLVPLIQVQVVRLIEVLPQIIEWVQQKLLSRFNDFINIGTFKNGLSATVSKSGWILDTILQSGHAIIGLAITLILTPVVTFYLLRDWDKVLNWITKHLPKTIKPTVIQLAKECDQILGEFLRGQLLVMLGLAIIYGLGLTLIGLRVGIIIGLIGGLLSIVPYLGSAFVVLGASIAALVQFGTWHSLIGVAAVFIIGQIIESYILTPYLVGERIGLHPVTVIFAVMAGGTLFGFFGVLLALPVAAVLKVLLRYFIKHYHLLGA